MTKNSVDVIDKQYTPSREPIARASNCAVVRTYCGHGINELFHTAPNVPHYAKNRAIGTMKPGMVCRNFTRIMAYLITYLSRRRSLSNL